VQDQGNFVGNFYPSIKLLSRNTVNLHLNPNVEAVNFFATASKCLCTEKLD